MEKSEIGNVMMALKEGDTVTVGDDVQIVVVSVGGNGTGRATRLRISAPKIKRITRIKNAPSDKL